MSRSHSLELEWVERVSIYRVAEREGAKLTHLEEQGLVPGRVKVREVREVDRIVSVGDEEGKTCILEEPLAASVFVRSASRS